MTKRSGIKPVIEYRYLRGDAAPTASDDNHLHGRAAPFNQMTTIGRSPWGFRETIKRGAFKKSLNDGDVVLLDNHMSERPLARQSAKTLDMVEGNKGLDWDADPTDTTYAEDVVKNVRAKNYGGCSFGFEVVSDTWNQDPDDGGLPIRTLNEVKLHEISVCTFPAYGGTTVSARDQVKAAQESYNRWYERELLDLEIETNDGDGEDFDDDDDDEERDGKKPYGNVAYADPKNGKYPIDTKAHVKAAWSYINQAKNAAKYPLNGVSLSSVKAKIKAAAKKFGITISDESKSEDGFEQFEELP